MPHNHHANHHAQFKCRLCGSDRLLLFYTQGNSDEYIFYRCPRCRLVNYDLSTGLNQEKYGFDFIDPRIEHPAHSQQDDSFAFIKRHFPKPGSLLEIGSGNGRILYRALREGWKVKAIELLEVKAVPVREALGVEVVVADFLAYETLPDETDEGYDLVVLRHVLEHLPDSLLAASKLRALMRPGGHALLEFPNIDALDMRVKRFLRRTAIHRRRYPAGYVPGHCNEFCRGSFEYLLGLSGLELVTWETYASRPSLAMTLYNRLCLGNKARALVRRA